MKIIGVKDGQIPGVKIVTFGRFLDQRGFFSEIYKKSDFDTNTELSFLKDIEFVQINVSYSKKNTIRGLHLQWSPTMGKLVRVTQGVMIDLFLDIRQGSPTYGKMGSYTMESSSEKDESEWIWVPEGFAHGSLYLEETMIEYLCTSEWSPKTEASISPFAPDIDWSLVDKHTKEEFDRVAQTSTLMTSKDKDGYTLFTWKQNEASKHFVYTS